jgi:3-oxoadipate enol-lactonase
MLGPGASAPAAAAAQAMMAGVPEPTYRSAVAALVAFDRRANLPLISVPTLVITGAHDRTAAPEVARKMAERIPGAALVIVPGAGHLLPMEDADAFNAALLAWLAPR